MTRPILRLSDVAARRLWCPHSGRRGRRGGRFSADCACVGPACAAWAWSDGDAEESRRERRPLLPEALGRNLRLRVVEELYPELAARFDAAYNGSDEARDQARAEILAWCRDAAPLVEEGGRLVDAVWDDDADVPCLILDVVNRDRGGTCSVGR